MAKIPSFSLTGWLYRLGDRIGFRPSPAGTSYPKEEKENVLDKVRYVLHPYVRKVKLALSKMAEQSAILSWIRGGIKRFFTTRVRSFSVLFFTGGFLLLLSYFLSPYLPGLSGGVGNLLFGVALIFLTLVSSFARGTVTDVVKKSFFFRAFLSPVMGVRDWQLPTGKSRDSLGGMILWGAVLGILSAVFSPGAILFALLLLILFLSIFSFPERGMILLGILVAFLPSAWIDVLVFVLLAAFFCKCAIGKRSLVFSPLDAVTTLLLLPLLLRGEVGREIFFTMFFLTILVSGLIRTLASFRRQITSLCLSAFFCALLLILRALLLWIKPNAFFRFPGLEMLFFVPVREQVGGLLAILSPLFLGLMKGASNRGKRLVYGIGYLTVLGGIAFVQDPLIWLAAGVGFLMYFIFSYRPALILTGAFCLLAMTLFQILPLSVLQKISSFFGVSSASSDVPSVGVFQIIFRQGGAYWMVVLAVVLAFFLYRVIRFARHTTNEKVHPQVLSVLCAMSAYFTLSFRWVPDERGLALFFLVLALPRAAFLAARREEVRLPY